MEHLFHPSSGDYQVTLRRLLGLLYEGVELDFGHFYVFGIQVAQCLIILV